MREAAFSAYRGRLAGLFLFEGVDLDAVERLVPHLTEVVLEAGEILFTPGEPNDTMYLILEGRLEVKLESPDSQPMTVLEPGESVGELSVIDHLETSAFVTAATASRLAVMDQLTLWTLINEVEGFARNLLHIVSRRVRSDNERMLVTQKRQRKWERYATVDALTGLHNRRWLDATLGRLIERDRRADTPLAFIMLDVDHFKAYTASCCPTPTGSPRYWWPSGCIRPSAAPPSAVPMAAICPGSPPRSASPSCRPTTPSPHWSGGRTGPSTGPSRRDATASGAAECRNRCVSAHSLLSLPVGERLPPDHVSSVIRHRLPSRLTEDRQNNKN